MTLSDYLKANELTLTEFARRIGTSHARTVERYAKGQQVPNREMMTRIVEVTGGAVTPNDFFGIEPAQDAAA